MRRIVIKFIAEDSLNGAGLSEKMAHAFYDHANFQSLSVAENVLKWTRKLPLP